MKDASAPAQSFSQLSGLNRQIGDIVFGLSSLKPGYRNAYQYASGSEHIGRLIVWLILSKFGYWPTLWPWKIGPITPTY